MVRKKNELKTPLPKPSLLLSLYFTPGSSTFPALSLVAQIGQGVRSCHLSIAVPPTLLSHAFTYFSLGSSMDCSMEVCPDVFMDCREAACFAMAVFRACGAHLHSGIWSTSSYPSSDLYVLQGCFLSLFITAALLNIFCQRCYHLADGLIVSCGEPLWS